MAYTFGSLVFTPVVKALQEHYGSRRQYARREASGLDSDRIGPEEVKFLEEADSFFIASIGSTGWPYVQHRGGPKGFLRVIDQQTIAFADFRGNKQFISIGNLTTDDRVALILMDYPRHARLKVLGHAKILDGASAKELIEKVASPAYEAVVERVVVIKVEAFDWNCPQHITQRFTEEQIRTALGPVEAQMAELVRENEALRAEIARLAA